MKPLFLFMCLIFGIVSQAQQFTKPNNSYGNIENRKRVDTLFAGPQDTFFVPVIYRNIMWESIKADNTGKPIKYCWNPTTGKWEVCGGSASGFMLYTDTTAMLSGYPRVQRFLDSLSAIRSSINGVNPFRFGRTGEDNSLTEGRTVTQNGFGITFNGGSFNVLSGSSSGSWSTFGVNNVASSFNTFVGAGSATTGTALNSGIPYARLLAGYQSNSSELLVKPDVIHLNPQSGALKVEKMKPTTDSAFKPMVWDSVSKDWKYFPYWPGWGGSEEADSFSLYVDTPAYFEGDTLKFYDFQPGVQRGFMSDAVWNLKEDAFSVLSPTKGGTGLSTLGTAGQSIRVNSGGTGFEFYTPSSGSGGTPSLNDVAGVGASTAIPLTLSGKLTLPGGSYAEEWTAAGVGTTWLNMSTSGPSGIGHGGPGANPWIAFVASNTQYMTDAVVGDIVYRGSRLLFGNGPGASGFYLDSNIMYLRKAPTVFGWSGSGTRMVVADANGNTSTQAIPSAGITDHGALTGLADDDHSQYLLLSGRGGQTISDRINIGNGALASSSPALFIDVDNTHTGPQLAIGQDGNQNYFTIQGGNITNLGGYAVSIIGTGSGAYFPNGISFLHTASAQNGGAVLKGLSFNQPWVFDNSAITSSGVVGLTVKGSNSATAGDLLQLLTHNGSAMFKVTYDGQTYIPVIGGTSEGLLSIDPTGKVINTEIDPASLVKAYASYALVVDKAFSASNTAEVIPIDTELEEYNIAHAGSSEEITVSYTGKYLFSATIHVQGSGDAVKLGMQEWNGTAWVNLPTSVTIVRAENNNTFHGTLNYVHSATGGDKFRYVVSSTSTSAILNAISAGDGVEAVPAFRVTIQKL